MKRPVASIVSVSVLAAIGLTGCAPGGTIETGVFLGPRGEAEVHIDGRLHSIQVVNRGEARVQTTLVENDVAVMHETLDHNGEMFTNRHEIDTIEFVNESDISASLDIVLRTAGGIRLVQHLDRAHGTGRD